MHFLARVDGVRCNKCLSLDMFCLLPHKLDESFKKNVCSRCALLLKDPSSCSNITEVVANHFDLDAEVDFTAKRLRGTITVDFSRKESTQRIILDVHCLDIGRVLLVGDDGVMTELSFEVYRI